MKTTCPDCLDTGIATNPITGARGPCDCKSAPNPILALCDATLALDAKATNNADLCVLGEIWITAPSQETTASIAAIRRGCEEAGGDAENEADAALVVAYRTSAPRLARLVKIAVEEIENAPHALSCHLNSTRRPFGEESRALFDAKGCTCWKSRALAAIAKEVES